MLLRGHCRSGASNSTSEKMFTGKIFYTSGLGGIYPSGVKIGTLDKINKGDVNNIELEIRLTANPISDDLLGVISL